MSTHNDHIQILHTIRGRNVEIPNGLDLGFLDDVLSTELFLSIPRHLQQNALCALCVVTSGNRFQSNEEFWECARDVFLGFDRENQFNFAECSGPFGLDTMFLHDRRARISFREIYSRKKIDALQELHRRSNFERNPIQRKVFAKSIFNSYPTKIDMIVGTTIYLPRSIRQDDLLSADVSKALYAIRKSERAKAVCAFNDRLRGRNFNMRELQSLAVSTFQEYSSTSTDCSHQQINFDVEDDYPSTLSPNQSSSSNDLQQVNFDEVTAPSTLSPNQSLTSSTKDTQDMVVEDNQTKAAEVAVSEVKISMSAELSDLTSTRIPRKPSKKEEEKADEREGKANRLYQLTMDTPQFVHYNMTEAERLEAAKTSTVCPELSKKFCNKYGKAGEDDLKYWKDMKVPGAEDLNLPGAVINVILSQFLSSTFKADEYPNSGTRIEFLHPKVIQIVVDRYLEFGAIVGPLTYHGNWRPGDLVHVYDMAFSPLDGGISSISHMRSLYDGKKGVYRQACKNHLGMQDAPSVRMQIFDELQFLLPHTFNDSWKDFGKSLRPDHPLSVLVKKLVHISPLIRKDLVQAILSVMDEHCAKPVLIVNRVSEETKKKFTNYVSFLKILRPELPYVELYHPTWFAKNKIPWLVQWIKVTDATVEIIFHFCGEKYFIGEKEATKEEVREMLGDKGMEYIFKNGYNGLRIEPYTEDEREEIKNRKAGTAFVNGSTFGVPKGTKLTDEEKASRGFQKGSIPWNKGLKMTVEQKAARKRTAGKNGNTIGFQKGNYFGRSNKKSKK